MADQAKIYTVEIDGKQYDIEGTRPPTEAEAREAVKSYQATSDLREPTTYIGGVAQSVRDTLGHYGKGIASGLNPAEALKSIWASRNDTLPYQPSDTPATAMARLKANDASGGLPDLSNPETGGRVTGQLLQALLLGRAAPFVASKAAQLVEGVKKADVRADLAHLAVGYRGSKAMTVAGKLREAMATTPEPVAEPMIQGVPVSELRNAGVGESAINVGLHGRTVASAVKATQTAAADAKVRLTLNESLAASKLYLDGMSKGEALAAVLAKRP